MKDRAEPKYITPYLPYDLKYQDTNTGKLYFFMLTFIDELRHEYNKLILRPMSDLDKEVKHESGDMVKYSELLDESDLSWLTTGHIDDWKNVSVRCYEFLLEHHFDLFGLIEKGQAIDINTIN